MAEGGLEGASSSGDLENWMNGALRVERLPFSEEAHCGGSLGRAPLLGTQDDSLRKAPVTGISVHRGLCTLEGEPGIRKGDTYTGDLE